MKIEITKFDIPFLIGAIALLILLIIALYLGK